MNSINKLASELVSALSLVSPEIQEEAHATANRLKIPFGRVLVMHKLIGEGDLTSILKAACLVHRNELPFTEACFYLDLALRDCEPIEEVVERFSATTFQVLRFIIRAGIVTEAMLIALNRKAQLRQTTLGEILVDDGIISQKTLRAAIDVLVLMRNEQVSDTVAVVLIRLVHFYQYSVCEALNHTGAAPQVLAECRKHGVGVSVAANEITRPMRILDDNMIALRTLSAAVA